VEQAGASGKKSQRLPFVPRQLIKEDKGKVQGLKMIVAIYEIV